MGYDGKLGGGTGRTFGIETVKVLFNTADNITKFHFLPLTRNARIAAWVIRLFLLPNFCKQKSTEISPDAFYPKVGMTAGDVLFP